MSKHLKVAAPEAGYRIYYAVDDGPWIDSGVDTDDSNEMSFVAQALTADQNGSSLVLDKPSGVQEGDLLIAVMATGDSRTWNSPPTGWTQQACYASARPNVRVCTKIAGASEPSSYTFSVNSGTDLSGVILAYRNAQFDEVGTIAFASGGDSLSLPQVPVFVNGALLFAVFASRLGTWSTPAGMTDLAYDETAQRPNFKVCGEVVNIGYSGNRDSSFTSSDNIAGLLFTIKPASVGTETVLSDVLPDSGEVKIFLAKEGRRDWQTKKTINGDVSVSPQPRRVIDASPDGDGTGGTFSLGGATPSTLAMTMSAILSLIQAQEARYSTQGQAVYLLSLKAGIGGESVFPQ